MQLKKTISENFKWVEDVFQKIDKKLSVVSKRSQNKLPYTTVNGIHVDYQPYFWTSGFWGGLNCLMYEATGKEIYKETALKAQSLLDKAFESFDELHHDVGFMWHLSSVALYRLFGYKDSRTRGLIAASILSSRFNVKGKYIRAWNGVVRGDDSKGLTIIDTMLNLPLLYWASKETGDDRFYNVAVAQADMTIKEHVREDYTVNHVVVHDPKTGKKIVVRAGQGYSENSAWARGQSWALYGFVLSYIHTNDERYLNIAKGVADNFIKESEKTNWLVKLDFRQPEEPKYYDASAAAIASCGLIELAKILSDTEGEKYLSSAINILKATEKEWGDWDENTDSIIVGSSESYAGGRHKNIIYGDFYFVEAILKLKGREFLIW